MYKNCLMFVCTGILSLCLLDQPFFGLLSLFGLRANVLFSFRALLADLTAYSCSNLNLSASLSSGYREEWSRFIEAYTVTTSVQPQWNDVCFEINGLFFQVCTTYASLRANRTSDFIYVLWRRASQCMYIYYVQYGITICQPTLVGFKHILGF